MTASKLSLLCPLRGWCAPLDEVPDPVFAGRMMGDGVAIDPTGNTLYAPCDALLVAIPASRHALTLRAQDGAEILLHIGIDTVGLGEGFELHARIGQRVNAGERLITFDLDLLARRARSVLTPIILIDSGLSITRRSQDCALEVGDFLLEISPRAEVSKGLPIVAKSESRFEREVQVSLEHGIHARPAALLSASVRDLEADVSITTAVGRSANARSPVGLMSLGVRKGERVKVTASGRDAFTAVATIDRVLMAAPIEPERVSIGGLEKPRDQVSFGVHEKSVAAGAGPVVSSSEAVLKGVIASRGLALGPVRQFKRAVVDVVEEGAGVAREAAELDRALAAVRADLQRSMGMVGSAAREITSAHIALLDDPELRSQAQTLIANGKSAAYAWRCVLHSGIDALRALGDPRIAERADDLLDLESKVISILHRPAAPPGTSQDLIGASNCILVARELLPSDLVAMEGEKPAGICLAGGGATSHVAIIAASMDIPTLVSVGNDVLRIADDTLVLLDAESGCLHTSPHQDRLGPVRARIGDLRGRRNAEREAARTDGRTADGIRINVFANVGSVEEAQLASESGAEGCGLLRTEFLFLDRTEPPGEAEQLERYRQIVRAMGNRPVAIRTLDIGGDKPIAYLPLPDEENPALGLRGVRTSLWRPDLLRVQLRAILRACDAGRCHVLLPMITDVSEIRAVRSMINELSAELGNTDAVSLGAMIETPASALMADRLSREADFLSMGTNDLTQYTLAMDRGHSELAPRLDALHPAVLKLIAQTVDAAAVHARPVSVCGALASDPVAVPILIGLGINTLSMVPALIPRMKALIATLRMADCRPVARQALEQETAAEVRAEGLRMFSELGAPVRTWS